MSSFYESDDTTLWEEALKSYPERLRGLGKERLSDLDDFYRIELVKRLKEREAPAHITKDELVQIVDWKLTRGKWRPRLLGYAKDAAESDVTETSKRAFAALPDVQSSIKILSELKGIGPATASAVLAAYRPDLALFMSDEALAAALGGVKDYTPKKYAELTEALTAKAKLLGRRSTGLPWTPSDVERAIWSEDAKGRQKEGAKTTSKAAAKKGAEKQVSSAKDAGTKSKRDSNDEPKAAKERKTVKELEKDPSPGSKRKKGTREQAGRKVKSKA